MPTTPRMEQRKLRSGGIARLPTAVGAERSHPVGLGEAREHANTRVLLRGVIPIPDRRWHGLGV
jgi:hypothetical protein